VTSPTSTPSAQGIEPTALVALLDALEADPRIEPHGLIVQRHGATVLEAHWHPHRAGQQRLVYSLSKSFAGIALGLAVGDGLLSLDDTVEDHLADLAAGADERTRRMRIRHLASMATGHEEETLLAALLEDPTDIVRGFLQVPPEHEPGTHFTYNQPPVLAFATIVQRLTGERLLDQLRPRVLDPLGIRDLRWYQYRPGVDLGFSGVFTDLDAIARLGQLHLDDGMWQGRRLLPVGWVDAASRVQIESSHRPEPDWSRGYGFQLWMNRHGYRGDGAYGQYMVVLPEQDAVVAFFSHTEPMQAFMDHLWEHLLPAFGMPGDPDADGDAALAARIADLHVPTAAERVGSSGAAAAPAAFADGRFVRAAGPTPSHPSVTAVEVDRGALVLHEDVGTIRVPLTPGWSDVPGSPIAASATVDDDGHLVVDLAMLATPHRLEVTVDPRSGEFIATWPLYPLFGLGIDGVLARMRPPDDDDPA
jgi:hypothetical protein